MIIIESVLPPVSDERKVFLLWSTHCSAVITRSSGAMNTDRVIRGPRYTWSALYGT